MAKEFLKLSCKILKPVERRPESVLAECADVSRIWMERWTSNHQSEARSSESPSHSRKICSLRPTHPPRRVPLQLNHALVPNRVPPIPRTPAYTREMKSRSKVCVYDRRLKR